MRIRKLVAIMLVMLIFFVGCNKEDSTIQTNVSNTSKDSNMPLQLETKYFRFYSGKQEKECLKDLSNTLEENYPRVTKNLQKTLDKKVDIYIYSDLDTYHKETFQSNAPSWGVGNAIPWENTIQMVNPNKADGRPYEDFMKVIVHEFTHIVIYNINSTLSGFPKWLSEGVAVYEAQQGDGVEDTFSKAKAVKKVPTLKDLDTTSYSFGDMGGYQFSYSIVDFIAKKYGYEKLVALIKSPADFEKALGVTKDEFEKQWMEH